MVKGKKSINRKAARIFDAIHNRYLRGFAAFCIVIYSFFYTRTLDVLKFLLTCFIDVLLLPLYIVYKLYHDLEAISNFTKIGFYWDKMDDEPKVIIVKGGDD